MSKAESVATFQNEPVHQLVFREQGDERPSLQLVNWVHGRKAALFVPESTAGGFAGLDTVEFQVEDLEHGGPFVFHQMLN